MSRGLVMLTLMVAAVAHCSQWQAMAIAEDSHQLGQEVELGKRRTTLSDDYPMGCGRLLYCLVDLGFSCITSCCVPFGPSFPPMRKCKCWRYAEQNYGQSLAVLQNYCGFKKPSLCPRLQVGEISEVVYNNSRTNNQQVQQEEQKPKCCAKDREKIQSCMLNTASIDDCCPTFKIMLGNNCDCYNYAKNLDNLALITLESYCDVTNPCKSAQMM